MKLVILGNGFDLHHGLRTSFAHYRDYLIANNKNDIVTKVDSLITRQKGKSDFKTIDWNDIEKYLFKEFDSIRMSNTHSGEQKKILYNNLEQDMEKFTEGLYQYLIQISKSLNFKENITIKKELKSSNVILTFNYTSLYNQYKLDNNPEIFHIHGNLSENDLPLIGYYCDVHRSKKQSEDHHVLYSGYFIHKPALAWKQNNISFEHRQQTFSTRFRSNIDEVVLIGFSFGESDRHIYNLLNELMVDQHTEERMLKATVEKTKKIKIRIFSYKESDTDLTIAKIKKILPRRFEVIKIGVGIIPETEELISFEKISY